MATTTAYNKMNDPSDIDQGTIGDEKWPEKQNYSELLSSASNTSRSEYRSIQHDKETIKADCLLLLNWSVVALMMDIHTIKQNRHQHTMNTIHLAR
eukprot:170062_1